MSRPLPIFLKRYLCRNPIAPGSYRTRQHAHKNAPIALITARRPGRAAHASSHSGAHCSNSARCPIASRIQALTARDGAATPIPKKTAGHRCVGNCAHRPPIGRCTSRFLHRSRSSPTLPLSVGLCEALSPRPCANHNTRLISRLPETRAMAPECLGPTCQHTATARRRVAPAAVYSVSDRLGV